MELRERGVILIFTALNESPSEKEGKLLVVIVQWCIMISLNESPSEKEGKLSPSTGWTCSGTRPSMKVPPKRKGNSTVWMCWDGGSESLNESPSEKEGKSRCVTCF